MNKKLEEAVGGPTGGNEIGERALVILKYNKTKSTVGGTNLEALSKTEHSPRFLGGYHIRWIDAVSFSPFQDIGVSQTADLLTFDRALIHLKKQDNSM